MNLAPHLKLLGFNQSDITVYLFLLENGLSTPPLVSRGTGIARTNCYNILEALKNLGLVEEQQHGNRKAYLASDPEALLRTLDKKREAVQQILPDLRGLYTTQKNKPRVRFYQDLEQIKEVYLQSLQSKKIMTIGSTNQAAELMPKFLDDYFAEIKKREIMFYDLLSSHSEQIANQTKEILQTYYNPKFLPNQPQEPPTNILIWDNTIALISLREPIFATTLTNDLLAQTFKLLFEVIYNTKT